MNNNNDLREYVAPKPLNVPCVIERGGLGCDAGIFDLVSELQETDANIKLGLLYFTGLNAVNRGLRHLDAQRGQLIGNRLLGHSGFDEAGDYVGWLVHGRDRNAHVH